MTDVLHLKHLRVRYRVDRDDPLLRRRLDGVLDRVLGEALEPALARSGVPTEEEICVRSLRVPVRVRLGAGEASAAAAWSAALAEAIAAALADGSRSDVVRFRSRRAALADLALAVAVGRLEHVWAWRQLGLWQGGDAPGERAAAWELATVLVSEPESIVPVLAEVAAAGTLPSLVERIEPTAWADLTRAALTASGSSAAALESVPAPGGDTAAERGRGSHLEDRARRVLERSAVARAAARALPPAGASQRGALAGALAVLAVLEAEPDAARAPDACADVAGAVAEALLRSHEGPDPAPAEDPREPEPRADEPVPAGAHEESAETEPEPRWATAHGGLLFLLPVLDDLRVPDEAMRSGALARRPLALVAPPSGADARSRRRARPGRARLRRAGARRRPARRRRASRGATPNSTPSLRSGSGSRRTSGRGSTAPTLSPTPSPGSSSSSSAAAAARSSSILAGSSSACRSTRCRRRSAGPVSTSTRAGSPGSAPS